MNLYLINFVENDYDTYDSMVIIANTRSEAKQLAVEKTGSSKQKIRTCNLVNLTRESQSRILCASFNAG